MLTRGRCAVVAAGLLALCATPALAAFEDEEPANFSKTNERFLHQTGTPEYQLLLRQKEAEATGEVEQIVLADPERRPIGNLCANHRDGCAGDVRFYDWDDEPGNIRRPVLWTARSGATISGHVWAVSAGARKRPGVVITNGSVQAPEQLYWAQAAALARAGYVVLTWDPQTQGRSDGPGAAPTENENSTPQSTGAFTDGTVDAIDFFNSTPAAPFRPRNAATNAAVNHSAKQNRRVAAGLNAAFNPLHGMLDRSGLGIAGHSLGAMAVSQVASEDTRVDAVVAWDQLRADPPPRVPGLGLSGDYGIGSPNGAAAVFARPRTEAPDPQGANGASHDFSKAGIPTAQVNTRAGTHFEPGVIPNPGFGATLRGIDQTAWYTIAWFEKYVKRDRSADRLLLTDRWQKDAASGKVDPAGDANLFSKDLRSRIDVALRAGGRALCEDLREGCGILAADGAGPFSVLDYAYGRQSLTVIQKRR